MSSARCWAAVMRAFLFAAITRSPDGSNVVSSLGNFLLSGQSFGYIVEFGSPGFATIRGPGSAGSNAPIIL
jgi:hypothetical protein